MCATVMGAKGHAFVKEVFFLFRFSLTLIDTLDTLMVSVFLSVLQKSRNFLFQFEVIQSVFFLGVFFFQLLNKTTEFEAAVRRVLSDVRLDNDIVVSVFETNIRVLG